MRKYLLIVMVLISSIIYSQSEYPKPYIVDGDTVGMIITLEQAQEIDNNFELLKLYEDLSFSYDKGDTVYLEVIGSMEEQIYVMKIEIETLKSVSSDKDSVIQMLKDQISLYKDNEEKYDQEIANKDLIIDEKDKQLRKNKIKMIFGGIGGGVAIIGLTILLILK